MRRVAVDLRDLFWNENLPDLQSPLERDEGTSEWFRENRRTYWFWQDEDYDSIGELVRAHLPDRVLLWQIKVNDDRTVLWAAPPSILRSYDTLKVTVSLQRARAQPAVSGGADKPLQLWCNFGAQFSH